MKKGRRFGKAFVRTPHKRLMRRARFHLVILIAVASLPGIAPRAAAAPTCFGKRPTLTGGPRSDNLRGTPRSDVIIGGGGDDRIRGGGGNDVICGFSGDDEIDGGGGRDRINGGMTDDLIRGGAGSDRLFGDDQNDVIHGQGGHDFIDGGNPETARELEYAYGGLGDDTIRNGGSIRAYGNKGDDDLQALYMEGGPGNDLLNGGLAAYNSATGPLAADMAEGKATAPNEGTDRLGRVAGIFGTPFDDELAADDDGAILCGSGGDDVISGGEGPDTVSSGPGADLVTTGAGDDELANAGHHQCFSPNAELDTADDSFDGGAGVDGIIYDGASPLHIDLELDVATGYGADTVTNIENVEGTRNADVLLGDGGPNYLYGDDGADEIVGRGGDDLLVDTYGSGTGDVDGISGGPGHDVLWGDGPDDLDGADGNDRFVGGARASGGVGDDVFVGARQLSDGGEGTDTITFENWPAATVDLAAGTASSAGTAGSVTSIENVTGSAADDSIAGDDAANLLVGLGDDDVILGRGGDDAMQGNDGDDSLDGGDGTDTLDGGRDTDDCTNGEDVRNCEK